LPWTTADWVMMAAGWPSTAVFHSSAHILVERKHLA
jgi:hypothetical protein